MHVVTASTPKKILIADDEDMVARSLARFLSSTGFEVTTVGDGGSAVEALRKHDYDAILSDIHMPGLSGVDLLRAVREHDLDVPVLLMTADPQVETAAEAIELGALQYLSKPIALDKLVKSIERATNLRRMAQMKRQSARLLEEERTSERADQEASFDRFLDTMWMAYQPILSSSGALFGYEALLRSNEKSLPHPGAVIGAAEALGRLHELGRRIRSRVAEEAVRVSDEVLIFVNLHAKDLLDAELVSLAEPLSGLAPRIVLEITERAALDEVKDVRGRIAALRALGYRIAVDDLGAGYAGLTSFALLEPEFVKLDMSLVRNVNASPIRRKLIGSMAQLCRDMGMRVVAEGIETIEERDVVVELGCDLCQGYLLGRPAPPFATPVWP